jgi:hypothetical protein
VERLSRCHLKEGEKRDEVVGEGDKPKGSKFFHMFYNEKNMVGALDVIINNINARA